jgi:hypothetical protein
MLQCYATALQLPDPDFHLIRIQMEEKEMKRQEKKTDSISTTVLINSTQLKLITINYAVGGQ